MIEGDLCRFRSSLDCNIHPKPARAGVECRKICRAIADDGNAEGFQQLPRFRQIENGFCARAYTYERSTSERRKVCRYVKRISRPAMHAAYSARRKDPESRTVRYLQRGRYSHS